MTRSSSSCQVMLTKNPDFQRGLVNGARAGRSGLSAWEIIDGKTLDCVEISVARVFERGQAYLVLSQARSLEDLRVMDFNPRVVRADPDVLFFYGKWRKE
ncbi:ATP-dependent DNA helicase PIF1-like [Oncorhynchus nerka]|uniref:ATP-dependent DNA helicase PIF1-like n=1 Tax=Oncorhynchus nerka TaxID=8023 RepID=UPI0011326C4B|nr:ATP-dependent DNA helicase PIF1-like [Oncorhynchus nerka]XP_029498111.1 ATP-dependent DNA helicase PIF1-like [Oncorhynchus nerka]XP_029498112.1 ATP-dependent DNA helicase PIF1-like [Oncorhynchus nerka]